MKNSLTVAQLVKKFTATQESHIFFAVLTLRTQQFRQTIQCIFRSIYQRYFCPSRRCGLDSWTYHYSGTRLTDYLIDRKFWSRPFVILNTCRRMQWTVTWIYCNCLFQNLNNIFILYLIKIQELIDLSPKFYHNAIKKTKQLQTLVREKELPVLN
jgi:hypothetical protein